MNRPIFRIRSTLIFIILTGTFLLTWYILMWSRLATSDGGYLSTDFRHMYTAGRLARLGHLSEIYNLDLQYDFQIKNFGVIFPRIDLLPFNHPPLLVPIQAALFSESVPLSYWMWAIFLCLLLTISAVILVRLLVWLGWKQSAAVLVTISMILFYPVFLNELQGNDTAFLFLGGAIWFYGLLKDNDRMAGIGLAVMTIRPQIALAMAIPFIFKRRKVWWWFCIGASVLVIYSLGMLGIKGAEDFINVLMVSGRGIGYGISQQKMFNFIGVVFRLFPTANSGIIQVIAWIIYILTIFFLSYTWWKTKKIGLNQIILAVVLCVFAAPHLHYRDLSLLVIALLPVAIDCVKTGILSTQKVMLAFLSISCLMVLADITFFRYWGPYILMIFLIAWPLVRGRIFALKKQPLIEEASFL